MKTLMIVFITIIGLKVGAVGQTETETIRIDPQPEKGFTYPYYLLVPKAFANAIYTDRTSTILVLPNNTGKPHDDFAVHEDDVKRRTTQSSAIAELLPAAILMPVFPRPAKDWRIYTHALDRDSLVTDQKEYRRLDLQLVSMIDDARRRLIQRKLRIDKRVLIMGYSASGMFTNRFIFLHPHRVKAAAIGSPGGWAMAPSAEYKQKTLRYPIGTGDFREVAGKRLAIEKLRRVPLFIYLGDKDENDSVIFGDSYDETDKELIFELFGKTPVERWEITKSLYGQAGMNAEFKLYAGVGHTVNAQMRDDIRAFLTKHLQ